MKIFLILYRNARSRLEELAAKSADPVQPRGQDDSPERVVEMFELLLQHSLIGVACFDGAPCKEEIAFVQSITKYADLVDFANKNGMALRWEDFLCGDVAAAEALLRDMLPLLSPLSDAFAAKFASFVRGGDKECYSLLTQGIHGAAALLAAVDGFPDYAEVASVYQTIVFDALREIYRLLDGNI